MVASNVNHQKGYKGDIVECHVLHGTSLSKSTISLYATNQGGRYKEGMQVVGVSPFASRREEVLLG